MSDSENNNQVIQSDEDLNRYIAHYYKSLNKAIRSFLYDVYPETDIEDVLDIYDLTLEDDEINTNKAYCVTDTNNYILVLIEHTKTEPVEINCNILEVINEDESKKHLMTYLNNSYKTIKFIIKKLENKHPEISLSDFEEGALWLKHTSSNNYLSYIVNIKPIDDLEQIA